MSQQADKLKILFQNENFVIIDKPAGVLSTPSRMGRTDPRPVAGLLLQEQCACQIFPVHRLDFEVSGILLFAKNEKAHRASNQWFESKQIQKIYSAQTTGQMPDEKKFEWKAKILRGKKRAYESPVGKDSLTRARLVGLSSEGYLQWELEPITGRSHQLRFDLSRHGYPILGDQLYGSSVELNENEISLRAVRIILPAEADSIWGIPTIVSV